MLPNSRQADEATSRTHCRRRMLTVVPTTIFIHCVGGNCNSWFQQILHHNKMCLSVDHVRMADHFFFLPMASIRDDIRR